MQATTSRQPYYIGGGLVTLFLLSQGFGVGALGVPLIIWHFMNKREEGHQQYFESGPIPLPAPPKHPAVAAMTATEQQTGVVVNNEFSPTVEVKTPSRTSEPSPYQGSKAPQYDGNWESIEVEEEPTDRDRVLSMAVDYFYVRIRGDQGSGKSTFVEWLISERLAKGYKTSVLNSHCYKGQYPDAVSVYGGKRNFGEIEKEIAGFLKELDVRYGAWYDNPDANFQPYHLVCEEMTNWSEAVTSAPKLISTAIQETRKVRMGITTVAHAKTNRANGGAKGLRAAVDNQSLDIVLLTKPDPSSGHGVSPSGEAMVSMPGSQDFIKVWIGDLRPEIAENLASIIPVEASLQDADPRHLDSSQREQAIEQMQKLKGQGMGKERTISTTFGINKGGGVDSKWGAASSIYDEFVGNSNGQ